MGASEAPGSAGHDVGVAEDDTDTRVLMHLGWFHGDRRMPAWIPRLLVLVVFTGALAYAATWAVVQLRGLLYMLVVSLFLSFAIEPAVKYLADHGWRRGLATAVVFVVLVLLIAGLIGTMIPLVVDQVTQLVERAPDYLRRGVDLLNRIPGVHLSSENLGEQVAGLELDLRGIAGNVAGNVLGFGSAILTALFRGLTIALFTFYIVADGPRLRRAICSTMRPERQREVLRAWELAIRKTGGWLYSRGLLAFASTFASFLVLQVLGVSFALPLSIWLGVVSQFIPTVGTYIGAALPLLIALLSDPWDALVFLIFVVVYQQIENYLLAPRVTASTMQMHPAVAFGAAIAGASLMGATGAVLALPAAATIQAFGSTYVRRHEVVTSDLTLSAAGEGADTPASAPDVAADAEPTADPGRGTPRDGGAGTDTSDDVTS
ncbi:MAG: AI-2E family transporter [Acidimicrobiia bacterium]|nr:AI-2E family transporter [Acidimicrobiia bacterium]